MSLSLWTFGSVNILTYMSPVLRSRSWPIINHQPFVTIWKNLNTPARIPRWALHIQLCDLNAAVLTIPCTLRHPGARPLTGAWDKITEDYVNFPANSFVPNSLTYAEFNPWSQNPCCFKHDPVNFPTNSFVPNSLTYAEFNPWSQNPCCFKHDPVINLQFDRHVCLCRHVIPPSMPRQAWSRHQIGVW